MGDDGVSIIKFGKNILKYSPSSFIPALIGFLTIPFLSKIFSPVEYGNYILVISIVNVLAIVINAVCGDSTIRFFTVYKVQKKLKSFYDSVMVLYLLLAIVMSFIFVVTLQVIGSNIDHNLYNLMLIGVPLFIFTTAFFVSGRILVAKENSGIYSFLVSFQSVLGFLFSVILIIIFKVGISGIIWGYILSFIIFLPIIYYYAFKGNYMGKNFSKPIFVNLIKYGLPVAITNMAAWVLSYFDRYVLGFYWGSAQVGIYSASYALSEMTMVVLLNLFILSGYPTMVKIWETKGKIHTQDYISKLTRYYLLIGIPAAVGLSILSKHIIAIITSPAYYMGYIIVPIVVFGALLLGLQWWAQLGLLLNNKTHIIAVVVLIAGIFNILTNFIFIPGYGFLGAAISTFVSYMVLLLLIILFSRPYLNLDIQFKSLIKISFSSVFMGSVLYFINQLVITPQIIYLIAEILIGMFLYLLMLFIVKEFKNEEISFIKKIFKSYKKS